MGKGVWGKERRKGWGGGVQLRGVQQEGGQGTKKSNRSSLKGASQWEKSKLGTDVL